MRLKVKDLIELLLQQDTNSYIQFSYQTFGGYQTMAFKEIKEDIKSSPVADGLVYIRFY